MSEFGLPRLPSIKTVAYWHSKLVRPRHNQIYLCLTEQGTPSYRSWEDGAWWLLGDDGSWHPNDSFSYWAEVVLPEIARLKEKEMARA